MERTRRDPKWVPERNIKVKELQSENTRLMRKLQMAEDELRYLRTKYQRRSGCVAYIPNLVQGDVLARLNGKQKMCPDCNTRCLLNRGKILSISSNIASIQWKEESLCQRAAVYLGVWLKTFLVLTMLMLAYAVHYYCKIYAYNDVAKIAEALIWCAKQIPVLAAILAMLFATIIYPQFEDVAYT